MQTGVLAVKVSEDSLGDEIRGESNDQRVGEDGEAGKAGHDLHPDTSIILENDKICWNSKSNGKTNNTAKYSFSFYFL